MHQNIVLLRKKSDNKKKVITFNAIKLYSKTFKLYYSYKKLLNRYNDKQKTMYKFYGHFQVSN